MQDKFRPKKSIFIIVFFALAFSVSSVRAESYDFYVDKGYSGEEKDGSSEKPFTEISQAVKKAGKGSKIYVKNGEYKENVVLGSDMELHGQDKKKTVIKVTGGVAITAPDDNLIKKLTVTGGSTGILFQGSGEVTDSIIKNAYKKGIDLTEDSAEVVIKKNTLEGNGKGAYVQKGRKIEITNNEVINNGEEGLDLREKVSGKISNNYIVGNGESGIEFIVGSSDLSINGNEIRKNKSSGLAAQFYTQAKKIGQVAISKNTISANSHYGLTCKAPSGGSYPKSYWNDSLELADNKIEDNKSKAIAGSCKLMEAVSEEELKRNQMIESAMAAERAEAEEEAALLEAQRAQEEAERLAREEAKRQMEIIRQEIQNNESQLKIATEELRKENKMKIFFIGSDVKKINSLKEKIRSLNDQASSLRQEFENDLEEDVKNSLIEFVQETQNKSDSYISILQEQEDKFSLFGWLVRRWA